MSVRIDEKHGVNPSLDLCFYCQEARGVVLLGKLTAQQKRVFEEAGVSSHDKDESPRQLCYSMEPCDTCKGYMEKGIIVISVKDEDEGNENPFRTGGWVVLREEALERIIDNSPELLADIKKRRVVFMPDGAWDMLGLPREPTTCRDCSATEGLTYGPCPYDHDINGDETPVWLCADCTHDRTMDI